MAAPVMSIPQALSKSKLDALQVSVSEVEPESPPHDMERLTMQSPPPRLDSTTVVRPIHDANRLRASSPTGSVRSSYTSHRRVSRRSHWSHSTSRSHHSEVSKELTIRAESEFFALMELMSGITLRSSSLKEVWKKIISERESHASEIDCLYERIEEYTEIIERHEKEKHSHNHDHEERKKELLKIRLELKLAIEASVGYKKRLTDKDCELEKVRGELAELKDNFKYLKEEHEETKTTLEETQLKLVASEERCRHANEEIEKHHSEIKNWKHKYAELQTSRTELSTKYESTHKEMISLKQISSTLRKEKSEWLHEKDELEEDLRKCRHHEQEHKRQIKELTESFEKKKHEVHELTEKVTKVKHEREELHKQVKTLKTQLEEAHNKCEASDHACRKWKRKHEECDRDLLTLREEFTVLQTTHTETTELLTKKTEEYRSLVLEKEQLQDSHHAKCKEAAECHRQILILQESLRRTESSLKEKLEIIHTHTEHIERLQLELSTSKTAHADLSANLSISQSSLLSVQLSLDTLTSEHSCLTEKLCESESRYEAISQQLEHFHESNEGVEEEYEEMLREAREQKEEAIRMRAEADRMRDEAVQRYEERCREVERLRRRGGGGLVRIMGGSVRGSVVGEGEGDSEEL